MNFFPCIPCIFLLGLLTTMYFLFIVLQEYKTYTRKDWRNLIIVFILIWIVGYPLIYWINIAGG